MNKHRRILDKFSRLGISKKLVITFIAIFSVVSVSTAAHAVGRTSEQTTLFRQNYVVQADPYVVKINVKAKEAANIPDTSTGDHGFMTVNTQGAEGANASFTLLPIIICFVATIIAFVFLTKAKTLKRKNGSFSNSFRLFNSNSPRALQKIRNPALLIAICFGIGVATPLFILNSFISIATTGIEKVNYEEHDFDADIKNGVNPFQIAFKPLSIKYGSSENFYTAEIKIEAETYNPSGYTIYLDPDCVTTNYFMGERTICKKTGTDLVGEKAKIPSIKKEMTLEELKKQTSAGWGWSTDGKTFYPADKLLSLTNGGTVYYAVKTTDKTTSGEYSIPQNVIAVTNSIDDKFAKYTLSYDTGEQETKTFYKEKPGYFIVKTPNNREGYIFKGWSTDSSTNVAYRPGDHLTPTSELTTLKGVWEKDGFDYDYRISFDQGYYFQELYEGANGAIAGLCNISDRKCFDPDNDIDDNTEASLRAGAIPYRHNNVDGGRDHYDFIVEDKHTPSNDNSYTISLNKEEENGTIVGDPLYIPKLKGYTFLGWTDFEFAGDSEGEFIDSCKIIELESHDDSSSVIVSGTTTELDAAIHCLSSWEGGTFYHFFNNKFEIAGKGSGGPDETNTTNESTDTQNEGIEDNKVAITLTPEKERLTLHAVYMLNPIKYRVNYLNSSGETTSSVNTEDNASIFTKSYNGRTVNVSPLNNGKWHSKSYGKDFEGSERLIITWEDMLNANSDNGNSTLGIEILEPVAVSTTSNGGSTSTGGSVSPQSLNAPLGTRSLATVLDEYYGNKDEENEEDEEEEEEKEEEKEEKTAETQLKKAEKRTVTVTPTAEAEKTEEEAEKKEKLKEQTDDNGTTLLYYDDETTSTPYYVKPLGVKEESLYEKSGNSVVTTICIIVLIVSGLGIASIIIFPALAKRRAKKQKPSRF